MLCKNPTDKTLFLAMSPAPLTQNSLRGPHRDDFPGLAGLKIDDAELLRLAQQGFVACEIRGASRYYKLRFRDMHNRQIVRYIGCNEERAATIRRELDQLQAHAKLFRELNFCTKQAKRALREAKRAVEPWLQSLGCHFHGFQIRKTQRRSDA
jgi:hypothetical protein